MLLENYIKDILTEVEKICDFNYEELEKALEICDEKAKPNCTFFIRKLSKDAKELIPKFYKSLQNCNIESIKDLTFRENSVSFNIDLKKYGKEIVETILCKNDCYGKNNIGNDQTVLVDFSSPNIAKKFHLGHFRTTVIGNFVKKLHDFCGYKAIGINYLGDWGKQFGLVLLGFEKYGSEEMLLKDPHKHLFDVYVKINDEIRKNPEIEVEAKKIFELMENENNEKYIKLWSKFREISVEKYKELYKKIGVEFDEYSGESFYERKAKKFAEECKFASKNSDNSVHFNLDGSSKPLLLKSDGTTLYLTRDIIAAFDRVERYNPEKILYVVASEQSLHFELLFKILKKLGIKCNDMQHVKYGLVRGMSTRRGTVHFLEDIINLAKEVMLNEIKLNEEKASVIEDIDETALVLAVSTLIISDFSAKKIKDYTFNINDRVKNVKGNGPYIQYAHCRLKSIEEMNKEIDSDPSLCILDELFESEDVCKLLYKLVWFEKVVITSLKELDASRIVTYINELCSFVNSMNTKLRVKGVEKNTAYSRLQLFKCARIVIGNSLKLFGLTPLNRM